MIQTYSKLISNSSEILPSQLVSLCVVGKVHLYPRSPSPTEFSFASIQAKMLPPSERKVGNFWKIWRPCVMSHVIHVLHLPVSTASSSVLFMTFMSSIYRGCAFRAVVSVSAVHPKDFSSFPIWAVPMRRSASSARQWSGM